jgi:hypothetical protein
MKSSTGADDCKPLHIRMKHGGVPRGAWTENLPEWLSPRAWTEGRIGRTRVPDATLGEVERILV